MKKALITVALLAILAGGAYVALGIGDTNAPTPQAQTTPNATTLIQATLEAAPLPSAVQVVANAMVVPIQSAELRFPTSGVVTEVLVAPGARVEKGTPLARLDTRALDLGLAQAKASLAQAQAEYGQLLAGATPEAIEAARAQVAQAKAQLLETRGRVTQLDIAAAQEALNQARATLAELQAGPNPADLRTAEAAHDQASAQLQEQRDALSADKTNAQLQMGQRVNDLTQAQSSYSTAKQNWQYVQDTGRDPLNVTSDPQSGKRSHPKISDQQRQQYYSAYVQAEATMHSAEAAVKQAQVTYDNARLAEQNGVAAAEAELRAAQAGLDRLTAGSAPDKLVSARAQVAQAEANLAKLQGDQRSGSIQADTAAVANAQATLAQIVATPRPTDLASALAQVQNAEVVLRQAELALDQATLKAPFAGTVARINLRTGEIPATEKAAIVLADLTSWQVETTNLAERHAARVRSGDKTTITLDALPSVRLPGTVARVEAIGENKQGEIIYTAVISLDQPDPRLRWNMTASVVILSE